MSNNLVLVTHAGFAEGILTAFELIIGNPCPTSVVSVTMSETVPTVASLIVHAIDAMDSAKPTVVLTDMPGGSTTQGAILACANRPNVYVVTGLTLGLLLEIALLPLRAADRSTREDNLSLLRKAVDASRAGIGLIEDLTSELKVFSGDPNSEEL